MGYQAVSLNIRLYHEPHRWVLRGPLVLTSVDDETAGYSVLKDSTGAGVGIMSGYLNSRQ